jgi:hypothetical protein
MWRELGEVITFFARHSPVDFSLGRIRKFFSKKRARQELNLGP